MTLVLKDRVKETTTTTGTGTVTLAGAVTGYQSFAAIGNGNTTYYCIAGQTGSEWEVGIGTYTSAGTTLSRDTVLASSNAGALVTFSAGTKDVFCTYSAEIATPSDSTGYTTTATAAGTTTLTVASTYLQYFTGSTTQTVVMPVSSTLSLGWSFHICNNSTGNITVNSSGGNLIGTIVPNTTMHITCVDITVVTAAAWDYGFTDFNSITGTGSTVLATNPTLTRPVLAAGTATAGTAPLKFTSGTNLTTAEAGVKEYDGAVFYSTNDATSGRGYAAATQIFRLAASGAAIGPAIANFFGANSAINLIGNGVYEIEAHCYFTKTTAGTVTVTATTSLAPVNLNGVILTGAVGGGTAVGAANQIALYNSVATAAAFGATASLTTAVNHYMKISLIVEANASASNLRINFTSSAGTVTPLRGSYYKVTRLPAGNSGSYAA